MNTRYLAAKVIDEVTQGKSLAEVLPIELAKITSTKDRAFVQAMCFGVCRYYPRLDFYLSHLLQKPLRAKETLVHALLLVGLYQLSDMRVPEHAAVAETVAATQKMKKPWAKGLVNAVLREFIREKNKLLQAMENDDVAKFAHDAWWIKKIKSSFPNDWQSILIANNAHPPFVLRVNQQKNSRDDYLQLLNANEISAEKLSENEVGIKLDEAIPVEKLPNWQEGFVSVQDGAAQLAAALLQLEKGQRVLDACAAPGGKLFHILEIEPSVEVVAVEKDKARLTSIIENGKRLQLKMKLVNADASKPKTWWDEKLFDRILLDAPCSASGVIRRHPDIKLLRENTDIAQFAKIQYQILTALWPLLKKDGVMVYATCSIFTEENADVITRFANENADVKIDFTRQILPGENDMDGFYYARLIKK